MTWGKGRLEMGWVEIDVEMGEDAQSLYELLIRTPAVAKPAITTIPHTHFTTRDFEVEMWARPWMVEVSRNSRRRSMAACSWGSTALH